MYVFIKHDLENALVNIANNPQSFGTMVTITEYFPGVDTKTPTSAKYSVIPTDMQTNQIDPSFMYLYTRYQAMIRPENISQRPDPTDLLDYETYEKYFNISIEYLRQRFPMLTFDYSSISTLYKHYESAQRKRKIMGVMNISVETLVTLGNDLNRIFLPELSFSKIPNYQTFYCALHRFLPDFTDSLVVNQYVYLEYLASKGVNDIYDNENISNQLIGVNMSLVEMSNWIAQYAGNPLADLLKAEISDVNNTHPMFNSYYAYMFSIGVNMINAKALLNYHPNMINETIIKVRSSLKLDAPENGVLLTVNNPFSNADIVKKAALSLL